jgi:DNA repair exonuclease SbcCD ATPase subunit
MLGIEIMKQVDTGKLSQTLSNELLNSNTTTSNTFASPSINDGSIFCAALKHLEMENFLGIQGTITIPFNEMEDGVWFIEGVNGAGKSTILEALSWVQFGRVLRSEVNADDVINESIGKNCRVKLTFENGFAIERFRAYNHLGGNGLKVYKDNMNLPLYETGEIRTAQLNIERLLGINFETFARTVINK